MDVFFPKFTGNEPLTDIPQMTPYVGLNYRPKGRIEELKTAFLAVWRGIGRSTAFNGVFRTPCL
jgi:hypothetical protein